MSKTYKKLLSLLSNTILAIFIVIGLLLIVSILPNKNILKLLAVQTGSMEPTLKTGSLILVRPVSDYKIGDIISFKPDVHKTNLDNVTHRIVNIENINGKTLYSTKGDANNVQDGDKIEKSQIFGKVFIKAPYLGYIIGYLRTLPGLIILIIIPSLIIIFEEINNIKNETKRMLRDKVKKQDQNDFFS